MKDMLFQAVKSYIISEKTWYLGTSAAPLKEIPHKNMKANVFASYLY